MAGGGGNNGGGIPPASRKMVQSLKEIVSGVTDAEIYSTLKECNMDPNEAVNRLLSQDTFHEVKSKREKKKEFKDSTESRPRGGGGSTSNRGARSGTDRYASRAGATHFNSSESGGLYGKPTYKKENSTSFSVSSTTPAPRVAPRNANWHPSSYSDSLGLQNKTPTFSAADSVSVSQPSSGYQSAWLGAPGQKSMAEVVKMGRPQNKSYTTSNPSQQSISHNFVPEYDVSPDNEWPSMEQPQAATVVDTHAESGVNLDHPNLSIDKNNEFKEYEINEVEVQDKSSSEEQIDTHGPTSVNEPELLYGDGTYDKFDCYHPHDDAFEHEEEEEEEDDEEEEEEEEEEEDDVPISSVSENVQKLSVQEEERSVQPEEDTPSVVIPNHLQVHTADCSHLSFGSFGANLNAGLSRPSSVDQSETTNLEYYEDGPTRTLTGTENYELPSSSQSEVLKQEDPEVTHGSQSQYGFSHNPQLLNPSFPQSQTPAQTQISTPFLNVMQAAANGYPVRESDLVYSQFSASQPMPTRYPNSASSINDPTISMAEALKSVGISSSQPAQQTSLPSGPGVPQHVTMHPYSQGNLPLGPFANMIGFPYMPQSYTYMPSGFQPTFAGNSSYHQQLAAMLPQYKNSVSASSLPQSAGVSGYGSFGGSTAVPGNYQFSQSAGPAGSTLNYEDVLLNAHYKDNSHLLSLQQNENSPMWVHGGGSRGVPASAYYNLQSQNQNASQNQASGFRQGQQQPSQNYGGAALSYPDFFHSQTGISQEHQLQQNSRDGSVVGGSQGQPKLQSQQLWQNGY